MRFPLIAKGEEAMPRITSMVVKLDNGKYRTIKLHKVRSIYTAEEYICNGKVEPGEDDVAGPETDKPEFTEETEKESFEGGGEAEDNGDPPNCHFINGVWVCL
jgi:hypothetical protein